MPPIAPNLTDRYKILYTVGGHQHAQIVRSEGITDANFDTVMDDYYTALGASIYSTTIDDVQFAFAGSNIFSPITSAIVGNTYGSGTPAVAGENAYFYSFVGRASGSGVRVRFYQFGAKALGSDYRYAPGENADLDAALAVIDTSLTGIFMAADGNNPTWKSYINAGVNAYWQRNLRP